MISIDQNCHPLWDVVPKLHALMSRGHAVTQYVEDIDVAFTAMGASRGMGVPVAAATVSPVSACDAGVPPACREGVSPSLLDSGAKKQRRNSEDADKMSATHAGGTPATHEGETPSSHADRTSATHLHLERERFYRSGGEDWGAALFYSEFLGRQAVDLHQWESALGMKLDVLARRLGRTMDGLYDDLSPGDTWQLIGPSYVSDNRHHRTIGDIASGEVEEFLWQLLGIAREDVLRRFPQKSSVAAATQWFAQQEAQLRQWLSPDAPRLVDVYNRWLASSLPRPGVKVALASQLFALEPGERIDLLQLFTRDYEQLATVYNAALHDCQLGLRPLNLAEGELPFFGVFEHEGRLVRSAARLEGGNIAIGDRSFALGPSGSLPLEQMKLAGIRALVGKAILLVLQVRLGTQGQSLAMPCHGSIYMPAAFCLERFLRARSFITQPVQPVVRVRFGLLDRLRELDTIINLPEHLQPYFGRQEVPARDLGNEWRDIQAQASERLAKFGDAGYHLQWVRQALPELARRLDELDGRKRELAAVNGKDPALRQLWKEIKPLQAQQLQAVLDQIARDWQAARIDFYDSRGAIWPWCVALGGQEFYEHVINEAEIYDERA